VHAIRRGGDGAVLHCCCVLPGSQDAGPHLAQAALTGRTGAAATSNSTAAASAAHAHRTVPAQGSAWMACSECCIMLSNCEKCAAGSHGVWRQVLRAYLDQLFSPEVLGVGGAKPPALPGTRIIAPSSAHPEDHAAAVAALPDTDSPALFGLPANIDKTVHRASGDRVVALLRQMSRSQACAWRAGPPSGVTW
jgi:hypothetical protein